MVLMVFLVVVYVCCFGFIMFDMVVLLQICFFVGQVFWSSNGFFIRRDLDCECCRYLVLVWKLCCNCFEFQKIFKVEFVVFVVVVGLFVIVEGYVLVWVCIVDVDIIGVELVGDMMGVFRI